MSKKVLTVLLGSSALVSIASMAQAQQQTQQQRQAQQQTAQQKITQNACDRLVTRLQQGQTAGSLTLQQAQQLQRAENLPECRRINQQFRTAQTSDEQGRIVVQQRPPQVSIDQVAPQITVQQPRPQVNVRQPVPQIIVRQAPPTITVQQPPPEITVRMPEPEVSVAMAQPRVSVENPVPNLEVVSPEARAPVQVQRAEPQVRVIEPEGEIRPTIQQSGAPQVRFERSGEPRVIVQENQQAPQIRVERLTADQSAQQNQQQPRATAQQRQQLATRPTAPETTGAATQRQTAVGQQAGVGEQAAGQRVLVSTLIDQPVYGANGQQLGTVERVVADANGRRFAVIAHGGFLGIGERQVPISLQNLTYADNRLFAPNMTEAQLNQTQEFTAGNYTDVGNDDEVWFHQ